MQLERDTIVAISTPPGRGGIGIVRLSGAEARSIAELLLRLRHPLAPAQARFGAVIDEAGETLDEAVVTFFAAPHSATGEDVVEIAAHGSPVLLERMVRLALGRGARLAEPGEFTQRAFLGGRIDLVQAEAVHDLIAAQTLQQARVAAAQMGGSVAEAVRPVKGALIQLLAELEAGIDFAEDDLDLLPESEIAGRMSTLHEGLSALAGTYRYGRILREGARLAIVGRPNAGKSSLFNALLGTERAIVTAQPGTTRDLVAERLSIEGVPVELVDTAGLRELPESAEADPERAGIARSRAAMAEADLVLQVVDATAGLTLEDEQTAAALTGRATLLAWNKCDLAAAHRSPADAANRSPADALRVSARTGEGLEALRAAIAEALGAQAETDTAVITNLRQATKLRESIAALERALTAVRLGTPHEFLILDLRAGLDALDALTGVTSTEDVLAVIFSSFCIGK